MVGVYFEIIRSGASAMPTTRGASAGKGIPATPARRLRAGACAVWLLATALQGEARAERVEVSLAGVDPREPGQVVLFLIDAAGKRMLPISVSPDQAESIYRGRSGVATPRPMTHELMVRVLEALGARLTRVDITELRDNTFYALLSLEAGGRSLQVDSRPSDAIALALRVKAPIFAEEGLLMPFERSPRPSVESHPLLSGLGLHLQNLSDDLARFFGVPDTRGVLVAEASSGSTAARSGVERGDVIRRIGGENVATVTEALAALRAARERGKPVEVRVVRDGRERQIRLEW